MLAPPATAADRPYNIYIVLTHIIIILFIVHVGYARNNNNIIRYVFDVLQRADIMCNVNKPVKKNK